jgi:aryl-alcohol dehydrogenase-like predicted oxidoreductase
MQLDHVDVIYAIAPPAGLTVRTVVEQVAEVISQGLARHWGTGMWSGAQHHEALDACDDVGVAPPACAQMATSLVDHRGPDDPQMRLAFERGRIGLVASYVLAGGTLTGKYVHQTDRTIGGGRAADDDGAVITAGKQLAVRLVAFAEDWGLPAAHLAFAYAFQHPHLSSVVFGARTAEQIEQNVAAWSTFERLDDQQRQIIAGLAVPG